MAANAQPAPESEPTDFVRCRVCDQRFPVINNLHLRVHGTTLAEYQKRYPDAPTVSDALREKKREGQKGRWTTKARKAKAVDMKTALKKLLRACEIRAAELAAVPLSPKAMLTAKEAAERLGVPLQLLKSWTSHGYTQKPSRPDGLYTASEVQALIAWKAERPERLADYKRDWANTKYANDLRWKERKLAQGRASQARVKADPKRARKQRKRRRKYQRTYREAHPEKAKQYRQKQKAKLRKAKAMEALNGKPAWMQVAGNYLLPSD